MGDRLIRFPAQFGDIMAGVGMYPDTLGEAHAVVFIPMECVVSRASLSFRNITANPAHYPITVRIRPYWRGGIPRVPGNMLFSPFADIAIPAPLPSDQTIFREMENSNDEVPYVGIVPYPREGVYLHVSVVHGAGAESPPILLFEDLCVSFYGHSADGEWMCCRWRIDDLAAVADGGFHGGFQFFGRAVDIQGVYVGGMLDGSPTMTEKIVRILKGTVGSTPAVSIREDPFTWTWPSPPVIWPSSTAAPPYTGWGEYHKADASWAAARLEANEWVGLEVPAGASQNARGCEFTLLAKPSV